MFPPAVSGTYIKGAFMLARVTNIGVEPITAKHIRSCSRHVHRDGTPMSLAWRETIRFQRAYCRTQDIDLKDFSRPATLNLTEWTILKRPIVTVWVTDVSRPATQISIY